MKRVLNIPRGLLLAIVLVGFVLLFAYAFKPAAASFPTPPSAGLPLDPASPFGITVSLPQGPDDLKSLGSWLHEDKSNILFLVHYKNISYRAIVLPAFAYWHPDIAFSCASWFAKPQPNFRTLNGQLSWVLVKPGESVTSFDDLTAYLLFRISGKYTVNYVVSVAYSYYTGDSEGESEFKIEKSYLASSLCTQATGTLEVPVTSAQIAAQSSWGK